MARAPIDWEAIEREYRAGLLSNRQIAQKYRCAESAVRARAKAHKWEKDLTGQVRSAANAKLLRFEERTAGDISATDAEIIENAATQLAALVLRHRVRLSNLNKSAEVMARRLAQYLANETPDGFFIGENESPSQLLERLTRTTSAIITEERKAFQVDDAGSTRGADSADVQRAVDEFDSFVANRTSS